MSSEVPIEVTRRANDPAVILEFESAAGVPFPLDGSVFDLTVAWGSANSIKHSSSADKSLAGVELPGDSVLILDNAAGRVTWPYTVEESLRLPASGAKYELFRTINGKRRLWCGGPVKVKSYL